MSDVFSFKDENKWLSLRYDLTSPLARFVAKNNQEFQKFINVINSKCISK